LDIHHSGSFSYILSSIWHIHWSALLNSDSIGVCDAPLCKQEGQAIENKSVVVERRRESKVYAD
jgi:hypothetical protein